jgi:hypothetical protein
VSAAVKDNHLPAVSDAAPVLPDRQSVLAIIEDAATPKGAQQIFRAADIARTWAIHTRNREAEIFAIEMGARSLRKMGSLLIQFGIRKGRKPNVRGMPISQTLDELNIPRRISARAQRLCRMSSEDFEKFLERRANPIPNPLHSSLSDEWLTPKKIIDRAVAVLGSIDLDPCASSEEPENVPAEMRIAKPDDGLAANWRGSVFLNPPYGGAVDDWCEKLIREWKAAHVTSAIALVAARTDTRWFRMFRFAPVCFIAGRLKFRRPGKAEDESAPFPSAVFYLGAEKKRFIGTFAQLGEVRDAAVAG